MQKKLQIKAKNKEEALEIAKQRFGFSENIEIKIEEIKKAKNIFGIINTKGVYDVIREEKQEVKEDLKKEDKAKETIEKKVEKLLKLMDLDLGITIDKTEDSLYIVNLSGRDNGIIIGKKGKTLNSFEYLLNTLIKGIRIEVDVEGFKEKRAETLRDLARKMAEKAIKTEKAVKLNPMPPRERKIIHEIVNKYNELDTYSEGKDPKRYIVIRKKRVD